MMLYSRKKPAGEEAVVGKRVRITTPKLTINDWTNSLSQLTTE